MTLQRSKTGVMTPTYAVIILKILVVLVHNLVVLDLLKRYVKPVSVQWSEQGMAETLKSMKSCIDIFQCNCRQIYYYGL